MAYNTLQPVGSGGTGATTASGARTNLGLGTSDTVTFGSLVLSAGGGLKTSQVAGDTLLLQAYDVDGAAYVTFATLTANNTPTFDLSASTTIGGNPIGSGDVTGPGSSTTRALAIFNGTTGKIIQNSAATLDSSSRLLLPTGTTSNVSCSVGGGANTGLNATSATACALIANGTTRITCSTNTTVGVNGECIIGNALTLKRTGYATNVTVNSSTDFIIGITDNSSARTVTLPSGPNTGATYVIKDEAGTAASANPITVTVSGGVKTIDGSTSVQITQNYGSLTVYYNGTNYFII